MDERTDRARARPGGNRWIRVAWVVLGVVAVAVAVLAITGGGDGEGGSSGGAAAHLQTYEVPNRAMLPGYAAESKVEVNQGAYAESEPRVGDVVVLHPPVAPGKGAACGARPKPGEPCPRPASAEANRIVIERVVAGPGDTVSIEHGVAIVNGAESEEAEVRPCPNGEACNLPRAIELGAGQYFVLGDNRQASDDSRSWGPVPAGWIIGKVE